MGLKDIVIFPLIKGKVVANLIFLLGEEETCFYFLCLWAMDNVSLLLQYISWNGTHLRQYQYLALIQM